MKKIKYISVFTAAVLMAGCLAGCGSGAAGAENSRNGNAAADTSGNMSADTGNGEDDGKLQIVTTIFPVYDWVVNVLGENPADAEVTMLLDSGVDLHSYQPAAGDIMKISRCDLFIYVGGESDEWVDDALEEAVNDDMVVIDLLDVLGDDVRVEEVVEGMQADEHEHGDEDEHANDDHETDEDAHNDVDEKTDEDAHNDADEINDEDTHNNSDEINNSDEKTDEDEHNDADDKNNGETYDDVRDDAGTDDQDEEYDEHVWLSLRNASVFADSIAGALGAVDPDNAVTYAENAELYKGKLSALDAEYSAAVEKGTVKTLLFGDRFPFRYLVDDYGLSYYAAFSGCSAETEASFETISFLSKKVDELSLHTVMTIEGTDHRIAETIIQNTKSKDQQIVTMDSMQSTTSKDVSNGATYLSVMEKNLEALKEAVLFAAGA